jgi:hypothetical protein
MANEVIFQGQSPYRLPTLQDAEATAIGHTVEATFYVFVPGVGSSPLPVLMDMTVEAALVLSTSLREASVRAQAHAQKP